MTKVQYMHTIDAKLASNIGEDSVSNPVQAIIELVKNSYDADANKVIVTFQGTDTTDDHVKDIHKIIIHDDGVGMTHEDLRDKFFRIGTDTKLRYTESPKYKRRVVGEKGMGHYAAKRLGKVCNITSNPENYPDREFSESIDKTITATLDWREFINGRDFEKIPSYGEIVDRKIDGTHGITIELGELGETKWDIERINQVRRELSMLIHPSILKKGDKFEIYVEAPGFTTEESRIDDSALDMALLKIHATAKYDPSLDLTKFSYNVYKRKRTTSGYIWDKKQIQGTYDHKIELEGPRFGNAAITIYHFPQFRKWGEEQKKIIQTKEIQRFMKQHSGIKIFNDGVRIMPYGDRNHQTLYDWAMLDQRLLQHGGGKIRQDTIVGFLFLTRDSNVEIREASTRESIKETPAFVSLIEDFITPTLEALEEFKDEAKDPPPQVFHEEKAQSSINQIKNHLKKTSMDPDERSQIFNKLDTVSKEIVNASEVSKDETAELMSTLDMYRPLSTLGISTLAFDHEIGPKLTIVNTYLKNLAEEKKLSKDSRNDIFTAIEKMKEVQSWREFLDIFADALSNTAKARKAKEPINFRELLKELTDSLKPVLVVRTKNSEKIPIQLDVSIIGNANKQFGNKASLLSIFTNLLLNSIKSLRFVEREKPVIKINIWTELRNLMIEVTDNGNGIPDENNKKIWKPFFTSYPKTGPKSELRGMGLGMTITKEIIREQYLGEIELIETQYDKEKPGKGFAVFLISIPLKELAEKV